MGGTEWRIRNAQQSAVSKHQGQKVRPKRAQHALCLGVLLHMSSHVSLLLCPHRSLGQNFCTDDAVLTDIVRAARISAADAVIEVGPGTGNLTRHLLATGAAVLAVEKDDTLVERLREEFAQVWCMQRSCAVELQHTTRTSRQGGRGCRLLQCACVQPATSWSVTGNRCLTLLT